MTLATIPRYHPERVSESGDHAVVVGGSMAGLFAARVLADASGAVTVLDRDRLPDEPIGRNGVPQAHHFHTLLKAGRATLEDLFPGFCEDLLKTGAVKVDASREVKFYMEGDFRAQPPADIPRNPAVVRVRRPPVHCCN